MRILILAFTQLDRDPRVKRQILSLKVQFEITAAGINDPELSVDFLKLPYSNSSYLEKALWGLFTFLGLPLLGYWCLSRNHRIHAVLKNAKPFDLIICNDLEPLPIAISLAKPWNAKVIFDAHEWYVDQTNGSLRHKLKSIWAHQILKKQISNVSVLTTVSKGLATLYQRNYGKVAEIILNAPETQPLQAKPVGSNIRMVHHGGANPNRQIEEMILLMDKLDDRFSLDLFLVFSDQNYFRKIAELCSQRDRVKLNPPWSPNEMLNGLNAFDIGFYFFKPLNTNLTINLPNKFFEFIQARLAVIAGPGGEMAELINNYKVGLPILTSDPDELAIVLNSLTPEMIMEWKTNSNLAAKDLSFESSRQHLIGIINKLMRGH